MQILANGQISNNSNGPVPHLSPHDTTTATTTIVNTSTTSRVDHDSPVIVHQSERQARVSFDLTNCNIEGQTEAILPDLKVDEIRQVNCHTSDSGSSCHSSKCCCSSYVCSVCSPRGSMDHMNHIVAQSDLCSAGSANSIDIASPKAIMDHAEFMEMTSKVTQTDFLGRGSSPSQGEVPNGKTEPKASSSPEVVVNPSTIETKYEVKKPPKTHRILINLDDKNRFTDEVTV